MFNGYLAPIVVGAIFLTVGLFLFRRAVRSKTETKSDRIVMGCFSTISMVVGGGLALGAIFTSPTPWERERRLDLLFETPADQIERITITPAHYQSLVKSTIVIDDPQQIARFAKVLHEARGIGPSHPRSIWSVRVSITTRDRGSYGFVANHTEEPRHATLVYVASNPDGDGWSLGAFRAAGLGKVIEEVATQAGAKR
jgi:hypothetical protein